MSGGSCASAREAKPSHVPFAGARNSGPSRRGDSLCRRERGLDSANALLATTTTDSYGEYAFTSLAAGTYKVAVIVPVGWGLTLKDAGAIDAIDSDADQGTGVTDAFAIAAGANDDTRDAGLVAANTTTTKTGPATATVGGQGSYTIAVTNHGPTAAKNVVTTDVLPAGTTHSSSSTACENSNGTVTCTTGSLGSNETVTYTVDVTFDTPGVKTNTGTTTSDTPDPNGNDNSSSTTTTVSDCSWLTISTAGTGSGSVSKTSSSSTFNCDNGNAQTRDYESGTVVTLSAAADPGSTFAGWSGDCTGTGTCTVTMDADKSVTATFNRGRRNQSAGNVCPAGDRNGNLDLTGDCAIEGRVKGNVKIKNGTLTVLGTVEGNIEQEGAGSVIVTAEGSVKGNLKEQGDGDVEVSGTVDGNIEEEGSGNVVVQGTVTGNVKEKDAGSVEIGGTVQGNVEEEGAGNVTITASGVVHGNVTEKNAGTVTNGGSVIGNISQS